MSERLTGMHFLGGLYLDLWHENGATHGRSAVGSHMFAPGTDRVRLGVLATLVDIVAGIPPEGPINPTIDLQVTLLAPTPSTGVIELVGRPVKQGRRLFLGEVLLHGEGESRPFAHGVATYMNRPAKPERVHTEYHWPDDFSVASFDEMLNVQSVGSAHAPAFEMESRDRIANSIGTVQGGAQAMLAEIAAEHVLPPGQEWAGVELDLRFVNRVKVGPLAAVPECQPPRLGSDAWVRVPLMEGPDQIVALAMVRFVPVEVFRSRAEG